MNIENLPLPQCAFGNALPFTLGPCLKSGGLIMIQQGDKNQTPSGWLKGNNNNNLIIENQKNDEWKPFREIKDKEISEGDQNYYFFTDNDSCDSAKLNVIDQFTGDCICHFDPFKDLDQIEINPTYNVDNARSLTNSSKCNGSPNLLGFNQGVGKEIIGAHSVNNGNKIITLTRSGMIRQWDIDFKNNCASPSGSPLKIFEAYAGKSYTNVENSWLSGNSLFVEVHTNEKWPTSNEENGEKKTLHQYNIRSNKLINKLELPEVFHVAVNKESLFIASWEGWNLPYHLKAYKIDSETLNLNQTLSFSTSNCYKCFIHQQLKVNERWAVLALEESKITILDINTGKMFREIISNTPFNGDIILLEDLLVFTEKNLQGEYKYCIANISNFVLIKHTDTIKINKKSQSPLGFYFLGAKFKIDLRNMKIYGLIAKKDGQHLIEISKGDKKS